MMRSVGLTFAIACAMESGVLGQDWKGRFENEAPRGWAVLSPQRFEYSIKYKRGTPESHATTVIKVGNRCRMIAGGSSDRELVLAANPRYRFRLVRIPAYKEWNIENIELGSFPDGFYQPELYLRSDVANEDGSTLERPAWLTQELNYLAHTALEIDICGEKIAQYVPNGGVNLFDTANFSVESASEVELDGHRVVQVEVTWRIGTTPMSATLWCDPKHNWAVVKWFRPFRFPYMGDPKYSQEFSIKYDDNEAEGFPQIRSMRSAMGGDVVVDQYLFDEFVKSQNPESEFTLTAFGLPEPPQLESRIGYWVVWAALAAVAMVAGGLYVGRRWRRAAH